MEFERNTPEPSIISEKHETADIYHLNNQKSKKINTSIAEKKEFNISYLKDIIVNVVLSNFVATYFLSAEVNITSLEKKSEYEKLEGKKDIW